MSNCYVAFIPWIRSGLAWSLVPISVKTSSTVGMGSILLLKWQTRN